jgi:cytoskeletal protein CcmA (bactofilin family)
MAKSIETEAPSVNLLGAGTTIKGDIKSNGDIRIDGSLFGSVQSKGKIILGPTGIIEGELICQNAELSGTVKANISVNELLTLKATAKISGDISTNKLAIEPGAKFSGSCNMIEPGLNRDQKPIIRDEQLQIKKETVA